MNTGQRDEELRRKNSGIDTTSTCSTTTTVKSRIKDGEDGLVGGLDQATVAVLATPRRIRTSQSIATTAGEEIISFDDVPKKTMNSSSEPAFLSSYQELDPFESSFGTGDFTLLTRTSTNSKDRSFRDSKNMHSTPVKKNKSGSSEKSKRSQRKELKSKLVAHRRAKEKKKTERDKRKREDKYHRINDNSTYSTPLDYQENIDISFHFQRISTRPSVPSLISNIDAVSSATTSKGDIIQSGDDIVVMGEVSTSDISPIFEPNASQDLSCELRTTTVFDNFTSKPTTESCATLSTDSISYTDTTISSYNLHHQSWNLYRQTLNSCKYGDGNDLILKDFGLDKNTCLQIVRDLCENEISLCSRLHQLCLSQNKIFQLPDMTVLHLSGLKKLELSQCNLTKLPLKWSLPNLERLNLSHNLLDTFPEEPALIGIPFLKYLNLSSNKIHHIVIPPRGTVCGSSSSTTTKVLSYLSHLDLGFNELDNLPDELVYIASLRVFKVANNLLKIIPESICNMAIQNLDVSSNPLIQPPIETCDRGIDSMKRYYQCLKKEGQAAYPFQAKPKDRIPRSKTFISTGIEHSHDLSLFEPQSLMSPSPFSPLQSRMPQTSKMIQKSPTKTILVDDLSKPGATYNKILLNKLLCESFPRISRTKSVPENELREISLTEKNNDDITLNDTLKVIFVGATSTGKTSVIQQLTQGSDAQISLQEQQTVGVEIVEWKPSINNRFRGKTWKDINTSIADDEHLPSNISKKPSEIKFSIWDFAGQHIYHATHALFFCRRALYIITWDMGAKVKNTFHKNSQYSKHDTDSSFSDEALETDIDKKVQFWIDFIQCSVPGAAIMAVATHDDYFDEDLSEGQRRCRMLKDRILYHEQKKKERLEGRLANLEKNNSAETDMARRIRNLLSMRPKLIFGKDDDSCGVVRVSGKHYKGFDHLAKTIINVSTGRGVGGQGHKYPIFQGHVGAQIPRTWLKVREVLKEFKEKVVAWECLFQALQSRGIDSVEDVSDALNFFNEIGQIAYFGGLEQKLNSPISNEQEASHTKLAIDYNQQSGLSQYIFLKPKWLMDAISCILRHDLEDQLNTLLLQGSQVKGVISSFSQHAYRSNFPVISSKDAHDLWRANLDTKDVGDIIEGNSEHIPLYDFLEKLLTAFKIFIPINFDAKMKRAVKANHFLPSLLKHENPSEKVWCYKSGTGEHHLLTICHSILFPDIAPPGLSERSQAFILSDVYHAIAQNLATNERNRKQLDVFKAECSCTALSLAFRSGSSSPIHIYLEFTDNANKQCVASKVMSIGSQRMTIYGQGSSTQSIWDGGFKIVLNAICRLITTEYGGLDYEEQIICSSCLGEGRVAEAECWELNTLMKRNCVGIKCKNMHNIDNAYLNLLAAKRKPKGEFSDVTRPKSFLDQAIRNPFHSIINMRKKNEKKPFAFPILEEIDDEVTQVRKETRTGIWEESTKGKEICISESTCSYGPLCMHKSGEIDFMYYKSDPRTKKIIVKIHSFQCIDANGSKRKVMALEHFRFPPHQEQCKKVSMMTGIVDGNLQLVNAPMSAQGEQFSMFTSVDLQNCQTFHGYDNPNQLAKEAYPKVQVGIDVTIATEYGFAGTSNECRSISPGDMLINSTIHCKNYDQMSAEIKYFALDFEIGHVHGPDHANEIEIQSDALTNTQIHFSQSYYAEGSESWSEIMELHEVKKIDRHTTSKGSKLISVVFEKNRRIFYDPQLDLSIGGPSKCQYRFCGQRKVIKKTEYKIQASTDLVGYLLGSMVSFGIPFKEVFGLVIPNVLGKQENIDLISVKISDHLESCCNVHPNVEKGKYLAYQLTRSSKVKKGKFTAIVADSSKSAFTFDMIYIEATNDRAKQAMKLLAGATFISYEKFFEAAGGKSLRSSNGDLPNSDLILYIYNLPGVIESHLVFRLDDFICQNEGRDHAKNESSKISTNLRNRLTKRFGKDTVDRICNGEGGTWEYMDILVGWTYAAPLNETEQIASILKQAKKYGADVAMRLKYQLPNTSLCLLLQNIPAFNLRKGKYKGPQVKIQLRDIADKKGVFKNDNDIAALIANRLGIRIKDQNMLKNIMSGKLGIWEVMDSKEEIWLVCDVESLSDYNDRLEEMLRGTDLLIKFTYRRESSLIFVILSVFVFIIILCYLQYLNFNQDPRKCYDTCTNIWCIFSCWMKEGNLDWAQDEF